MEKKTPFEQPTLLLRIKEILKKREEEIEELEKLKKELKKIREKLDGLKKFICNKYKFVEAIGIIPPQADEMYDEEKEVWYFSVVNIIAVLIEQSNFQTARKYWNKLKERLKKRGQ